MSVLVYIVLTVVIFGRARPGAEVGRATVSYENVVGLVLSVLLALFLAAALLFPERF